MQSGRTQVWLEDLTFGYHTSSIDSWRKESHYQPLAVAQSDALATGAALDWNSNPPHLMEL
jgi:hypothetical protein